MERVNSSCRSICIALNLPEPNMKLGFCSYCGSLSKNLTAAYLASDGEARWEEPATGKMVTKVALSHNNHFNLHHLFDEPYTREEYDVFCEALQNACGDLRIYMREINKYYE